MKRLSALIFLLINFMIFPLSFADETGKASSFRIFQKQELSFKINSLFMNVSDNGKKQAYLNPQDDDVFARERFSERIGIAVADFSLGTRGSLALSLENSPEVPVTEKNKKNYLKASLEITAVNMIVWAYDRYLLDRGWANISLNTVFKNLKESYAWDDNSFICNQFEHPYHGAMYHSIARSNGFSFLKSSIFTFFGSSMWEFILEANRPSTNDAIMTTFAGMPMGEVLFRISDLVLDESSRGFERFLRESLAFLINPTCGFRIFTGEAFKTGNPPEKHHYNLNFPISTYTNFTGKTNYMIAAHLEYQDALKKEDSKVRPYDWFSFDFRLGFDGGLRDKEIITAGFLVGKRFKDGLAGLFGVFDYIDTYTAGKVSAFGIGPGLVANVISESGLFFKGTTVLAGVFGGSSSSLDLNYYHFGNGTDEPYFLGPGMMGRIGLEAGKIGLGSVYSGFSQYWVHSMFTQANEFQGILEVGLKIDLPIIPPVALEYDYYIRHATHHEARYMGTKQAIRASLVLGF